ncbi:MAG TPA: amino acid racemase [Anaerolineales bacterium]|nr:amino acid racemase [Anaerolineales bacterium]
MKTLGIVGGIGPESTVEYYRLLVAAYRERRPDGSFPPILINSIDMTKMLALIGANQMTEVTGYLAAEVNKLARAGADFGLLASNTPHIVFDEVRRISKIPLISIVESARDAVLAKGISVVGLFGTRFTMQGSFYPDVFTKRGLQLILPDEAEQDYIHDKYMHELVHGLYLDETRRGLISVLDRIIDEQHIQGLVLGGTELPLILRDETYRGIPLFDTTKIHVERALARMLS